MGFHFISRVDNQYILDKGYLLNFRKNSKNYERYFRREVFNIENNLKNIKRFRFKEFFKASNTGTPMSINNVQSLKRQGKTKCMSLFLSYLIRHGSKAKFLKYLLVGIREYQNY